MSVSSLAMSLETVKAKQNSCHFMVSVINLISLIALQNLLVCNAYATDGHTY